jgi:hypothetical protein
VTNVAVITNAGPDIVTTNIGNAFKQKTPEAFAYDTDGNLTNDGRWSVGQTKATPIEIEFLSTLEVGHEYLFPAVFTEWQSRR